MRPALCGASRVVWMGVRCANDEAVVMMDPQVSADLIRAWRETFGDKAARQLIEKLDGQESRDKPPMKL